MLPQSFSRTQPSQYLDFNTLSRGPSLDMHSFLVKEIMRQLMWVDLKHYTHYTAIEI